MEISQELRNKILGYCEKNPIKIEFDYRDSLSKEQILQCLEPNGIRNLESELYDYNLDYIFDCENYFIEENLYQEFENDIIEELNQQQNDANKFENITKDDIMEFLKDEFLSEILSYIDIDKLIDINLTCLIPVYSNYDCCNSFDNPKEKESYLWEVYQRIKTGVKRNDFEYEFYNGAYGGSLFCFAFRTNLKNLIKLKELIKEHKFIQIPKGTSFGFFSSFQGAGSVFEKETYRTMTIPVNGETEYDRLNIIADIEQYYSMDDVYGSNDFVNEQNIDVFL